MVLHVRHFLAEIGREFLTHQNYFHVLYPAHAPARPPARMPRRSERLEAIDDIDNAIESATWSLVLLPLEEEDKVLEAYIRDLELIKDMICSYRYLSRGPSGSAGRHGSNSLEAYIYKYRESAFLTLFRMHRRSFWQLVELLSEAGGQEYWCQSYDKPGHPARQIFEQIAVALYVLGGGGTGETLIAWVVVSV